MEDHGHLPKWDSGSCDIDEVIRLRDRLCKKINALHERPPTRLFHYTDAQGLLGIIQSRALWLSDRRFMNDSAEGDYGHHRVSEIIAQAFSESGSFDVHRDIFATMKRVHDSDISRAVLLASFTAQGDALAMWTRYTEKACGYCIEFSVDESGLEQMGLWKAIYDKEIQSQIVTDACKILTETLGPEPLELTRTASVGDALAHLFRLSMIVFKHDSFRDEDEWRMACQIVEPKSFAKCSPGMEFRATEGRLVPYSVFKLGKGLQIRSITVGPGHQDARAYDGLCTLLKARALIKSVEAKPSECVYRPN